MKLLRRSQPWGDLELQGRIAINDCPGRGALRLSILPPQMARLPLALGGRSEKRGQTVVSPFLSLASGHSWRPGLRAPAVLMGSLPEAEGTNLPKLPEAEAGERASDEGGRQLRV